MKRWTRKIAFIFPSIRFFFWFRIANAHIYFGIVQHFNPDTSVFFCTQTTTQMCKLGAKLWHSIEIKKTREHLYSIWMRKNTDSQTFSWLHKLPISFNWNGIQLNFATEITQQQKINAHEIARMLAEMPFISVPIPNATIRALIRWDERTKIILLEYRYLFVNRFDGELIVSLRGSSFNLYFYVRLIQMMYG